MAYSYTYDRNNSDPYHSLRHYVGLTTDEKPVEHVPNGSDWAEMDGNNNTYRFDAEHQVWLLQTRTGDAGGAAAAAYTHAQALPAAVWRIQHNLGKKYPTIVCVDQDGNRIVGAAQYYSENLTILTFSEAMAGSAYLS